MRRWIAEKLYPYLQTNHLQVDGPVVETLWGKRVLTPDPGAAPTVPPLNPFWYTNEREGGDGSTLFLSFTDGVMFVPFSADPSQEFAIEAMRHYPMRPRISGADINAIQSGTNKVPRLSISAAGTYYVYGQCVMTPVYDQASDTASSGAVPGNFFSSQSGGPNPDTNSDAHVHNVEIPAITTIYTINQTSNPRPTILLTDNFESIQETATTWVEPMGLLVVEADAETGVLSVNLGISSWFRYGYVAFEQRQRIIINNTSTYTPVADSTTMEDGYLPSGVPIP